MQPATTTPSPFTTSVDGVLLIGHGLSSLVAATELLRRSIPVTILDQENAHNVGGQAFWSLGGIFLVNSAAQRRAGIKDSLELAWQDWLGTARFDDADGDGDGDRDYWGRQWARAFVRFAAGEDGDGEGGMEGYLKRRGVGVLTVGWAERGAGRGDGHGNSVPRFHLSWGTGPEVVRVFLEEVRRGEKRGLVRWLFRHRVNELVLGEGGEVVGVKGKVLAASEAERGVASSREEVGDFEIRARAVLLGTGGIGGNVEAVKRNWPVERLGPKVPSNFVVGVPAHVDGRMVTDIAPAAGASVVNMDRMWHYTEGLANWNPIWPDHGIRVIPGPSSLWLDANGQRMPPFLYPGCDTLAVLKHICNTGHGYSWFIANRAIVAREFSLSGSEQNPDITGKSYLQLLQRFFTKYGTPNVQAFLKNGVDFVVEEDLGKLVQGMNKLAKERDGPKLDETEVRRVVEARDAQMANAFAKDAQVMLIRNARQYGGDKRRIAEPRPLLDPKCGPLVAVRMNLLTRKSLGGLETDLDGRVLRATENPGPRSQTIAGLFAAGEAAGFGGGGVHGYSSLEGTFLGGCIFSGMKAGRAMAALVKGDAEVPRARL